MKKYGIFVLVVIFYMLVAMECFGGVCPISITFGIPCPGCGVTRALFFTLIGDFKTAFRYNPCIFPIFFLAIYYCVTYYIMGKRTKVTKYLLYVVAVIMILVYAYRMIFMFPGEEPMCNHYEHSLLNNMIKLIKSVFA